MPPNCEGKMKAELQNKLYSKYPKIFGQKDLPMNQTAMCWGIDCGDGWFWLLDNLCNSIQRYVDSRNDGVRIRNKARKEGRVEGDRIISTTEEEEWQVEAAQVKEKFGSLRFYINGGDDEIYGMINLAEHLSWHICENCGSIENIKHTTGWISTLCSKCFDIWEEKRGKPVKWSKEGEIEKSP